jgi:NADH:ubiquinone oxidoreductase subunit F (NADH-binding)
MEGNTDVIAPRFAPRLLAGPPPAAGTESLAQHRSRLGPPAGPGAQRDAIGLIEASGLLGRGGAAFPAGRKWRGIAERTTGGAVVVVNGAEGEPGSAKDRTLMAFRPHLVLDGAALAARAIGADEVIVYAGTEHRRAIAAMGRAIAERQHEGGVPVRLVEAPRGYVSGEQSAAVHYINTGDARPTASPPRPYERGVRGQPTLVQNVETLAHAALIARQGDAWYRSAGRGETRGTALVTVSAGPHHMSVREVELGMSVAEVLAGIGQGTDGMQAVLLGGYFGTWARADEARDLPLDPIVLRSRGLALGAGVVSILGADDCGVRVTSQLMSYMAGESAAQCGPCVFGLRSIAEALGRVASGVAPGDDLYRIERWADQVRGRGACAHPDGAVGLLASAFRTFGDEFLLHQRRRCSAPARAAEVA